MFGLCAPAVLASFGLYALRRARPADVPAVLTGGARPVVVLVLAALALLLAGCVRELRRRFDTRWGVARSREQPMYARTGGTPRSRILDHVGRPPRPSGRSLYLRAGRASSLGERCENESMSTIDPDAERNPIPGGCRD